MKTKINDEWKKRYEKLLELIDGVEYSAQQWQEIVEEHLGIQETEADIIVLSTDKLAELEEMFGLFTDSLRRGIKKLEDKEKAKQDKKK